MSNRLTDADARRVLVGCAGWSLPLAEQEHFPGEGTHLARYASVFPAAEINSSFHRPHRPTTYARWAESVPAGFRFSVKLPKAITHALRLAGAEAALDGFLAEARALGERLGCLLVQLPPSLAFDGGVAAAFFGALRERFAGEVACEPRNASWLSDDADGLLADFRIARVAADPTPAPGFEAPGGWSGMAYHRLHGSPRVYYSSYPGEFLAALAERVAGEAAAGVPVWCIFDNTASGAATGNARSLLHRLGAAGRTETADRIGLGPRP